MTSSTSNFPAQPPAKKQKHSFAPVRPANPGDASFPHTFPIELAMGLNPVKEICESYGLSKDAFEAISQIPQFQAIYDWAMEIKNEPNGVFRLQMTMMSDDIAKTIYSAMVDKEGGMSQRLRAAELAAKLAGLEPPKAKEQTAGNEKFSININFTQAPDGGVTITQEAAP